MDMQDMPKGKRFDRFYMNMALAAADFSYCKRKKVGAVIVKDDIIVLGYNGTISGFENCCEDESGETRPDVIHAEANAFNKIKNSTLTSTGATMYCTLSPCLSCAKEIIGSRIHRFVYIRSHSDQSGLDLMKAAGIFVQQMDEAEL